MQCEICGREAGKGRQIVLDRSSLVVCDKCVSFGVEKESEKTAERRIPAAPVRTIRPPRFEEKEFDLGLEIPPDFGKQIRKARELKDLTVKELAMKIFEKESLLHRIENQAIKPSDALIEKLVKQLGIQLKKKTL